MSAPAGKKEQPKKDKSYLARAVAAPKTPTGSGKSPLPSPPTWAPSPLSAAKAINATRPDAVQIDFGNGDGLPQRGEAAPEETSASPPAREPPAVLPVAADQAQSSTASEKRPRADDEDGKRKRPKSSQTEAPQPPLAAPSSVLAAATQAPATAPVPAAPTGGGRAKRPAPPPAALCGPIKFEANNPYPDGDDRRAYERYKDSLTIEAFFGNRGSIEDLARDYQKGLVTLCPTIDRVFRELLQSSKKPKTTDSQ